VSDLGRYPPVSVAVQTLSPITEEEPIVDRIIEIPYSKAQDSKGGKTPVSFETVESAEEQQYEISYSK
jgi:hypothetical protein